ncbi:MAG: sulfatase-like hydrolase/transferase [Verrucomicrobiota bacterium]
MIRKSFLAYVLCGLAAITSLQAKQPNVILILIDDLSHYGVSAYGAEKIGSAFDEFEDVAFETPQMDRLAAEGMRCDYAYIYPLCEPSRIALMSGKNNIRNFHKPKAQHQSDITFGDLFQRAGYETCIVGKWKQSRGTKAIKANDYIFEFGWDEFACFDVYTEGRRMLHPNVVVNGKPMKTEGIDPETGRRFYGPDIFNRYARDFIDRHQDKPFFLYYSMVLMHDEHTPTPDTEPKSVFDEYDHLHRRHPKAMQGDQPKFFPDMLKYTDKMVGQLLDHLKARNLEDDTLVILIGDNGTKESFTHILPDGTVFKGDKGSNKEGGMHVPLLLRAPGHIAAGSVYQGLVDVTDILPTIIDAAGIEHPNPEVLDGSSFWSQATGKSQQEHRDYIYTWYNANNESTNPEHQMTYVFTKDFKRYGPSVLYPEGRFFDLRTDLFETAGKEKKKVPRRWNKWHYSGLEMEEMDAEQQQAYADLGKILEQHAYVPVKGLAVEKVEATLRAGASEQLKPRITPEDATRQGLIWISSDPAVASVDKFGVVTAHQAGEVTITAYSWDDAYPMADNRKLEFSKEGIQDSIQVRVSK